MMFNITITIRQTVEGGKYTNDISIYFCRHANRVITFHHYRCTDNHGHIIGLNE